MTIEILAQDYGTADLAVRRILKTASATHGSGVISQIGHKAGRFYRAVTVRPSATTLKEFASLNLPLGAQLLVRA